MIYAIPPLIMLVVTIAFMCPIRSNKNKEVKVTQEKSKRELEHEIVRLKVEMLNRENERQAQIKLEQLKKEGEEWVKTQPKYVVVVKKLNGEEIRTKPFEAEVTTWISSNQWSQHVYPGISRTEHAYSYIANIDKREAKTIATEFVNRSIFSKEVVVGDLHILVHAIESLEVVEA
jgi:hypothetical protein